METDNDLPVMGGRIGLPIGPVRAPGRYAPLWICRRTSSASGWSLSAGAAPTRL